MYLLNFPLNQKYNTLILSMLTSSKSFLLEEDAKQQNCIYSICIDKALLVDTQTFNDCNWKAVMLLNP